MIKNGDIIELKIEKLVFTGSGLGRYDGNFAVFVQNSCPGDLLNVKVIKANKKYAIAEIIEIIEPSKYRSLPFCPIYNACGGCNWQHIDYDFSLVQKRLIIEDALKPLKYQPEISKTQRSPKNREFRCKVQYPIRETKISKRILAGYFKEKTHELTNVKFCPVQSTIIDKITEFVRANWSMGAYNEKTQKGLLKHLIIRKTHDDTQALFVLVLNLDLNSKEYIKIKQDLITFACALKKEFSIIKGVSVNFNPLNNNKITTGDIEIIAGEDHIFQKLVSDVTKTQRTYIISPLSFFQVNPLGAVNIFDTVKSFVKSNSYVLDAYGGVGTIGIWLSDKAKKIVLVEENPCAIKDAKENFKLNSCTNYEVFLGDAKARFKDFIKEKRRFTHVIVDPPRKGCDKEALEMISHLCDSIIYVSCNPQTLARDIKQLEEKGFKAKVVTPVDMFCHTYHIECVALIERELL